MSQGHGVISAAMAIALEIPWDIIRVEFSHGASLSQLSEKYGVAFGTLSARSSRENWMATRPQSHIQKAQSVQRALSEAAKSHGQSLAERGQAYAERMFKKVSALAEAANLPAPKNFKDLEIADKIARRAAGLEHAEVQVNTVIGVSATMDSLDSGPESVTEVTSELVSLGG